MHAPRGAKLRTREPEVERRWAEAASCFQHSVAKSPIVGGIDADVALEATWRLPPPEGRVGGKPANMAGSATVEAALVAASCRAPATRHLRTVAAEACFVAKALTPSTTTRWPWPGQVSQMGQTHASLLERMSRKNAYVPLLKI